MTVLTPVRPEPVEGPAHTKQAKQGHPAFDLLSRYKAIFQAAWQHRHELAGPARLADEAAFLPAALSLQETPVHPAPRRFAYGIMALFAIALAWSIIGKVDIVAVAPGRIVVSDRSKIIQPLEASIVRKVLVKDGDKVQAGQVLVELDPTIASADKASVQEQLKSSASDALRTRALLNALQGKGGASLPALQSLESAAASVKPLWTPSDQASTQAQTQAEWQDIAAKLAKLDAEAARRRAEISTTQQTIAKLEATLPLATKREADLKPLAADGYVPTHAYQDKARERLEMERDLTTQKARLAEAQAALNESDQARAAYRAETLRLVSDRHGQVTTKLAQLTQDETKATQRERQTQLKAPVSGTVQQLAIHSVGGVVTPAQPLMVVVPDSPTVTAEVEVANLDIGFVNAGQTAEVKLETFPYTKYGTVPAKLEFVTADAVTEEKKGSYYPARLVLSRSEMQIDGKRVGINPGMNVTAEIKTGERRVIEYLLSPALRATNESLRER